LKTLSGLAGNQNLPFMDGHELGFASIGMVGYRKILLDRNKLVRFAHNWNNGMMGFKVFFTIKMV
jgi:hypothetical protein